MVIAVRDDGRVLLAHGSGGRLSHQLIESLFLQEYGSEALRRLDDAAILEAAPGRLAFTSDSFVVKPLFFPGGDIGRLAICGTVNDLAMAGAVPRYIAATFIIEEGLRLDDLTRIARSMRLAAAESGVEIVTGDTKVVGAGQADGVFVTTTGIGVIPDGVEIKGAAARPGDRIILSGPIGDHGIAILGAREGFDFHGDIQSDCAPLSHLVQAILEISHEIRCLRDPTRGGLATTLNELAVQSGVAMRVSESAIPIREPVRAACELLGFDAMYVANEGKLVAIAGAEVAEALVEAMRRHPLGKDAAVIGEVLNGPPGRVTLATPIGGSRIIDMLSGELLPRIC